MHDPLSVEIKRNWQRSFLPPQIACKAVALFLHYLYTAAFTWMLCEGIHLYSKVVEVFSEGSKMKYYYALGWGRSNFFLGCSSTDTKRAWQLKNLLQLAVGQKLLRTPSAASPESTKFWPWWWRISMSIRVKTTLNHSRFVKSKLCYSF